MSCKSRLPSSAHAPQQILAIFDLDQAQLPPATGIYGMRRHALILIAWYSWFAVLLGALVYFLVG
jgi:hypothetical protein